MNISELLTVICGLAFTLFIWAWLVLLPVVGLVYFGGMLP